MKTITIPNPTITKPLNPNGKYALLNADDIVRCKKTMWGMALKNWQRGRTLYAIVLIDNKAHLCYSKDGHWNSIKEFLSFKIKEEPDVEINLPSEPKTTE